MQNRRGVMSSGNARADWRRRCVIHGEGCQYRLCKPKTRTACMLKRLLDRLACLKGFVRAQLADAKLSEWWLEGMPENTTGWAYDTWLCTAVFTCSPWGPMNCKRLLSRDAYANSYISA